MTPPDRQLVFLTYLSRSGSTYLARQLDAYQDVAVSLEADFPDGIAYEGAPIASTRANLEPALDALFALDKFQAWQVERPALHKALAARSFPVSFEAFLIEALQQHFRASEARIWIYKQGAYVWHLPEIRQRFPQARVLLILRDPRATYNSQKRSRLSTTGAPMASNPVAFARQFKGVMAVAERYRTAPWFHAVRYEDLVTDLQKQVRGVLRFLGASDAKAATDYANRIPASQQHLHAHVGKRPMTQRIDAWRQELEAVEIAAIQRVLGRTLAQAGYAPLRSLSLGLRQEGGFAKMVVDYLLDEGPRHLRRHLFTGRMARPS